MIERLHRLAEHLDEHLDQPTKAPPAHFKTPPYVICNPEVTRTKLASESTGMGEQHLRFLVLATDGLWDELSSKEVAALVWGHRNGHRENVPKKAINIRSPSETQPSRYNTGHSSPNWFFKDDNIATHLIRNALGSTTDNPDRL